MIEVSIEVKNCHVQCPRSILHSVLKFMCCISQDWRYLNLSSLSMVSMMSHMLFAVCMLGYIPLTGCLVCISLLSLPITLFMWIVEVTGRYYTVFFLSREPKLECVHRRRLLKIASRRNKQMRKQLRSSRKLLGRYFVMWLRVLFSSLLYPNPIGKCF